ncbi:MAG: DUF1566 domain-containing protein [Magnetococcales bacterium]|nr:DUF1566 domain-containing protein [Magnetococcales bacterium]
MIKNSSSRANGMLSLMMGVVVFFVILMGHATTPRFIDNGDGTVTDITTKIIWMKNAHCWDAMSWTNAVAQVTAFNNGSVTCPGFTGEQKEWRLPTIDEFRKIVETFHPQHPPALPPTAPFTGVLLRSYWSSSPAPARVPSAWSMNLANGFVSNNVKTSNYHVWLVKEGK